MGWKKRWDINYNFMLYDNNTAISILLYFKFYLGKLIEFKNELKLSLKKLYYSKTMFR
jgi:hypothetical protein